jgi:hypothetical protein
MDGSIRGEPMRYSKLARLPGWLPGGMTVTVCLFATPRALAQG